MYATIKRSRLPALGLAAATLTTVACALTFKDYPLEETTAGSTGTATGGAGGEGGAGTAGGPTFCSPGEQKDCPYGGDALTEDVGNCRTGARKCNKSGSAFGPCEGETLPKQ